MTSIYERWGVKLSKDEEWEMMVNRLITLLSSRPEVSHSELKLLAFRLGKRVGEVGSTGVPCRIYLEDLLNSAQNSFELASILEATIDVVEAIGEYQEVIIKVVNKSNCGINLTSTKDGIQAFPAGEPLLDKELVERPLGFLGGQALTEYSKALEHFSSAKWEECSEKVRRALEEYLRLKLGTQKGLEQAIKELGRILKDQVSFPVHLRTTVINLLTTLDKNFNESSKHHSRTYDKLESELLIYQAGLLMRFIEGVQIKY